LRRAPSDASNVSVVDTAAGVLILVVTLVSVVVVGALFVWAARKDGEEDRAVRKRLDIRGSRRGFEDARRRH
jgi:hypothetical protein